MRFSSIFSIAAMLAAPAVVSAQTVTVNKAGGTGVFTTISDALASFNQPEDTTPGDTVPNVVQVTDSGIYEEVITITTPVTLEGTGAEKATIELLPNPLGFYEYPGGSQGGTAYPAGNRHGYGGICINVPSTITSASVTLRNLNILPSLNSTLETRLRSAIENINNNLFLTLEDCLITGNNAHKPLESDPTSSTIALIFPGARDGNTLPPVYKYPATYDPNVVMFGAHGIVLGRTYVPGAVEGDGVELFMNNSVIHTLKSDYYAGITEPEREPTGIVMHTGFGNDHSNYDTTKRRITHIRDGGIAFTDHIISSIGDLLIEGVNEPVQLRGSATSHIKFDGPAFNYRQLNNVIMTDMSAHGIWDRGFGSVRLSMKDCLMFMNLNSLIRVEPVKNGATVINRAPGTMLIEDSTLVGGRLHATAGKLHTIRCEVDTDTNITFRNTILGGKKDSSRDPDPSAPSGTTFPFDFNVISGAGTNVFTFEGTAVINEGPYSFRQNASGTSAAFSMSATSSIVGTPTTAKDPLFLVVDNLTDARWPADPGFLDVRSSEYATADSTGQPLDGGADYIGDVPSGVSAWELY